MNKKTKKTITYTSLLIMGIGMLTFPLEPYSFMQKQPESNAFGKQALSESPSSYPEPSKNSVTEITPAPTTVSSPTPSQTPVSDTPTPPANITLPPEECPLISEVPDEIQSLVKQRYKALLADSIETLSNLLYGNDNVDVESILKQAEYIKDYQNIRCYTKQLQGPVDYIVYVRYDAKLVSISTPVPSLDEFYIRYSENGRPLIYLPDDLSEADNAYISQLREADDVRQLTDDVIKDLAAAVEKDSSLREFMQKIHEASPTP